MARRWRDLPQEERAMYKQPECPVLKSQHEISQKTRKRAWADIKERVRVLPDEF